MATTRQVKCNQNRIFGCGKVSSLSVVTYTVGADHQRFMASGNCQHCNLPLAVGGHGSRMGA